MRRGINNIYTPLFFRISAGTDEGRRILQKEKNDQISAEYWLFSKLLKILY